MQHLWTARTAVITVIVTALVLLIVGQPPVVAGRGQLAQPLQPIPQADMRPEAPEFPPNLEWLNTEKPLTLKELRGKVVLLDFWTYCCINCIHIIPDLKKLEAKYPNELVVIGVHSAKFFNERDSDNIREAILRYEIEHPVVNDRDFLIWNAYGARAWPTFVVIDPAGRYVGSAAGEGQLELLDATISTLIREFEAKAPGALNRKPITFTLEKDKRPKALLAYPGKIVADEKSRRLFFSDSNHNRIVIAGMDGQVQEIIGDGQIGLKDGSFETARFFRPQGVYFDAAHSMLYVADTENHAIRKIDLKARQVTTLAGNGRQARVYPPTPGTGKLVSLSSPWDLLLRNNTLYIAMAGSHQLWTLDLKTLRAAPFAGTGGENITDGPLHGALLAQPSGLATDGKLLFFADSEVSAVRQADLAGKTGVKTLVGRGLFEFGDKDGPAAQALLQHPIGVAYREGYVYIADTYNHKIKRINLKTRVLETVIGKGERGMADGAAKEATLNEPNGLAFAGGKLYIADTNNHMIRVYDPTNGRLATLTLTGLDRLSRAPAAAPAFTGKTRTLTAQEVAPTARVLELTINLPKGTKFSPGAPFRIQATSSKPESVAIAEFQIATPMEKLIIPILPKAGEATVAVELSINYCAEGNAGLCFFKEERLLIPVKVAPDGKETAAVTYDL